MNRRDALSRVAILLGGTLSAPTLMAMSRTEMPRVASRNVAATFTLTDTQRAIVAEVAEHIIPKTATAGAKEAGVPAFIEMMLADCYKQPEHESFLEGVADLEKKGFMSQSKDQQVATLKQIEADTKTLMAARNAQQVKVGDNVDKEIMNAAKKGVPFWRLMKELTFTGYFTSEKGIKENFEYLPTPGRLENIKVKPNQKAVVY